MNPADGPDPSERDVRLRPGVRLGSIRTCCGAGSMGVVGVGVALCVPAVPNRQDAPVAAAVRKGPDPVHPAGRNRVRRKAGAP